MSWTLTGIASKKRVGSTARKFLLVAMCDKANNDGTGVYASFGTLADMIESSRPTVKRIVKEFLSEGLIRHVGMRSCLNGETNEYDVIIEALHALPEIEEKKLNRGHGDPGSDRPRSTATPDPGHGDPTTRVMVTPKPILKPIQEPKTGSNEPGEGSKGKSSRKRNAYTPEFDAIWRSWPPHRRANSDKQTAFKRYQSGVEQFGPDAIDAAAKHYLAQATTRKENYRYCCLVEVFMNGKLEAAVEAVTDAKSSGDRRWDPVRKAFVSAA